ncbi:MAG TPA: CHAT domain-containing tetratricopeptide repeat protein [Candidatus Angelobacter sp.]
MFSAYKSVLIAAAVTLALFSGAANRCHAAQSASPQSTPTPKPPVPLALRPDSTPLYPQLKEAFLLARAGKVDEAAAGYRAVLEKAVATQDQPAQALAHDGLGLVLYYKAEYPAARAESEQALALYRTLQDPVSEAQTNGRLGAIAYDMGDESSAREYYHQALRSYDAMGVLSQRAALLMDLERAGEPEGKKLLHQALEIARQIGDKNLEASALHNLGDSLRAAGEFDAAQDNLSQAAVLYRATGNLKDLATVLTSEGIIQRVHGHPEKALPLYQQALDLQRKVGDRQGQIQSINAMAVAYEKMDEPARAAELYQQALAMARETGSPLLIKFELGNLASAYSELGRNQEAVTILEDLLRQGTEHADYRYQVLAGVYFHLGRFQESVNAASKAIDVARIGKNVDAVPHSLLWKARSEDKMGDHAPALADAQECLRTIERERAHLVPSDFMKRGFSEATQEAFDLYVGLLEQAHETVQALEVAEEARARAFLDLLATRDVEGPRGGQLASLRKVQGHLEAQGVDPSKVQPDSAAGILTRGATSETAALWNQWSSADAELRSLVSAQPFSVAQLQATARRLNSTVLSYWVSPDATYIWVVPADGVTHTAVVHVSDKRLHDLIRTLGPGAPPAKKESQVTTAERTAAPMARQSDAARRLSTRGGAALVLESAHRRNWRELYKLLVEPVEGWLPAKPGSLLTIEPHGPLLMLPFAALEDKNGRYLLERFSLHYTPAVSVLQFTEKKQKESRQLPSHYLLIADPSVTPRDPDEGVLPALPGARREVSAVARLLPAREVTMLEGSQAAEDRVWKLAGQNTVIHFATHGIIRDDQPFDSFLALGRSPIDPKEDGRLTAQKIYGLDLHANLVFLSACRSGQGKVTGDGLVGLTRAFWYAGTPSVIASLWDVADEPTSQLVANFYRSRLEGKDKSRALRLAQLRLLHRLRSGQVVVHTSAGQVTLPEDPMFWAAFVLQGEP